MEMFCILTAVILGVFPIIVRGQQDNSGLGAAVAAGRIDDVRRTLDAGIDVNARIYGGNVCGNWYLPDANAVMVAASCNRTADIIRLLLDRGTIMNYRTKYDYLALTLAVNNNNAAIVRLLLERGATSNAAYTALVLAAEKGFNDLINILLDHGAPINGRDNSGRTPLIYAAKNGQTETCRLLLDRGADINAVTVWAMSALYWAALNEHPDTYTFLLQKGASKKFCIYPMCTKAD